MDKLKEYEATGLTPHQIERMKARLPLRCWTDETTDKISIFNVSVNRLIELAKADRENRIVILPRVIEKPCLDCGYYGWDMPQCRECNSDNNWKYFNWKYNDNE